MAKLRFSSLSKDMMADFFRSLIDQDNKPGQLYIYSGILPASPDAAPNKDDLLGIVNFTYPSAKKAKNGTIILTFEETAVASATGQASWARITSNSGKVVLDCDISSDEETDITKRGILIVNSTDIKKGGPILISKMIFTVGLNK